MSSTSVNHNHPFKLIPSKDDIKKLLSFPGRRFRPLPVFEFEKTESGAVYHWVNLKDVLKRSPDQGSLFYQSILRPVRTLCNLACLVAVVGAILFYREGAIWHVSRSLHVSTPDAYEISERLDKQRPKIKRRRRKLVTEMKTGRIGFEGLDCVASYTTHLRGGRPTVDPEYECPWETKEREEYEKHLRETDPDAYDRYLDSFEK